MPVGFGERAARAAGQERNPAARVARSPGTRKARGRARGLSVVETADRHFLLRRSHRTTPAKGRPRPASASVAGSGTGGGVVVICPTGVIVSVMLLSISPVDRGFVPVKKLAWLSENCEEAEKFPSVNWPGPMVGPL